MPRGTRRAKGGARRGGRGSGQAPKGTRRRNWLNGAYVMFALFLVGIMILFLAINPASPSSEPPSPQASPTGLLPRIGDHWHAPYSISVCGTPVPRFPDDTSGIGIHTHNDGIIHVEPVRAADAGFNANMGRFMASTGGKLTEDSLQLPDGRRYTNGDPCPDGRPGSLTLRVNGRETRPIASYVPQNGDSIVLSFEPQP